MFQQLTTNKETKTAWNNSTLFNFDIYISIQAINNHSGNKNLCMTILIYFQAEMYTTFLAKDIPIHHHMTWHNTTKWNEHTVLTFISSSKNKNKYTPQYATLSIWDHCRHVHQHTTRLRCTSSAWHLHRYITSTVNLTLSCRKPLTSRKYTLGKNQ